VAPNRHRLILLLCLVLGTFAHSPIAGVAESSLAEVTQEVQRKIVKIYGAGGLKGLESYQSGSLVSAEGHILTAWSYVLDSSVITVVLDDGRHFKGNLAAAEPRFGIALLKIDGTDLPHFNIDQGVTPQVGDRILSFSNLFGIAAGDEPASVLSGYVSAIVPLKARRSAFPSAYQGNVLIVDAIVNNPGAAGGVLTDQQGRFAGMLGKELRSSINDIYLNYAIPVDQLREVVEDLISGRVRSITMPDRAKPEFPMTLRHLGLVLVPNVLDKTPPYVERVKSDSLAEDAKLQPDDLILFIEGNLVSSQQTLLEQFSYLDQDDTVSITVLRDGNLVEITLNPVQ